MLLLRGFRLLVLLPLLRFALFFTLLLVLCVGGSNGSKEEKQSPCADSKFHRHVSLLATLLQK
jgi:hypothetical protein